MTRIRPLALAAALLLGAAPAAAQRPPNVVLIMADDLGYGDVGPYGQRLIRTPSLDRMAREGTRFTQFYAGSTVCAPSRAVLLTGVQVGRNPIRGNREYPGGQHPLPAGTATLARLLQSRGYATGAYGKWSLGGPGTEGAPTRQGFDAFFGYLDQSRAHFYWPEWLDRNDGERVPLPGNQVRRPDVPASARVPEGAGWPVARGTYSHDAIADSALAFITDHRDRPFFLYVPLTLPHAELQAPDSAVRAYLDAEGKSVFPETPYAGARYSPQAMPRATYAAMVSILDRDVGRILDRLRALGLAEHTIVLFTSDNGPHREGGHDPDFFDGNGPLRGIKRDLYEGGVRVPMLAWAPGRVPAARTSDHVWGMWDILPTIAALAGAPAPRDVDGLVMTRALTGRGTPPRHAYVYWEFYEQGSAQAVRLGRWKAVRKPMLTGPVELYDLQADPGERRDVAAAHPDVVRRAERAMREAHRPSELWQPVGAPPVRASPAPGTAPAASPGR